MNNMKSPAVPVIMYHNIGVVTPGWIWNDLICPWELFEQQLLQLKRHNMNTISLQQLYDHRKNKTELPHRPIVLTFDDGYLDNWVFAYPLLKKYGFKGTIFVNPEFVDPRCIVRTSLLNVWNNEGDIEHLESKGFLSWEELKLMEDEGVMDIQSHSMSHTWYFTDETIIDFHHPGNNNYPWLFWNRHPERKSFYMTENQEHFVPYGAPIYKNGRSLGVKRYFEDEEFSRFMAHFVRTQGADFFKEQDWREKLFRQAEHYKSHKGLKGRFETDNEQKERYEYELMESRKLLEDKLKKKVEFLCWPGGALNDQSLQTAREAGYVSTTLLYDEIKVKNALGEDASEINRTGSSYAFFWRDRLISYTEPGFFIANIKYFQGHQIYLWIKRLYKIRYLIKFAIKKLLYGGKT